MGICGLRPQGWRKPVTALMCVLCLHPSGCSKMWDNLTCWPATPPGQVVVLACPLIFNLLSPTQGKSPGLKPGSWGSTSSASRGGCSPVLGSEKAKDGGQRGSSNRWGAFWEEGVLVLGL